MRKNIFDPERNCMTEEALREAVLAILPEAHRIDNARLIQIAIRSNASPETIEERIQEIRTLETDLIDAALTHRVAAMREKEFRAHVDTGSTAQDWIASCVNELEKKYPKIGIEDANIKISRLIMEAQKWVDQVGKYDKKSAAFSSRI